MKLPPADFLCSLKTALGASVTNDEIARALQELRSHHIRRIVEKSFQGKGLVFIEECLDYLKGRAPSPKAIDRRRAKSNRMLELYPDE